MDLRLQRQKSFVPGQIYTMLSRLRTHENLHCIEAFKEPAIKVNKDVLLEYESLKQNDLFSITKRNAVSVYAGNIVVHNVRSVPKTCRWYSK